MASFIYGKYPVQELLRINPKEVKKLWYVSKDHLQDLTNIDLLDKELIEPRLLSRQFGLKEFESHQGLLIELKRDLNSLLTTELENLIIKCSEAEKLIIWLPSIQDAHNLGAIIRASVAFGIVGGIVIPASNSVRLSQTVAKVSAGSIFSMNFAFSSNAKNSAKVFQSSGFKLVGIQKQENSMDLPSADFKSFGPTCLVFGSEEKGIPSPLLPFCENIIKIPQSEAVDSFNLSMAAGIVLYEINRQLKCI